MIFARKKAERMKIYNDMKKTEEARPLWGHGIIVPMDSQGSLSPDKLELLEVHIIELQLTFFLGPQQIHM